MRGRTKGTATTKFYKVSHDEKKKRLCLKCQTSFLSEGSHNRLCNECHRLIKYNDISEKSIYLKAEEMEG